MVVLKGHDTRNRLSSIVPIFIHSLCLCVYWVMHSIGGQLVPEVTTSTDFSILYHSDMILDYAEVALHFR